MEKLPSYGEPTFVETAGVTLKNQRHRFQLVLTNMQVWALYNVRVVVTGDLAPYITLGVIDSVPADNIFIGKTDDYYLGGAGLYPDVVRPLNKGDIILPPSANKCLLVCV